MTKDRPVTVWLGTGDEKLARMEALESLARKYAGLTRAGGHEQGNVSKLIQMIADGELKVRKR